MSADRRRPAWDEVREKQRRDRARVDAEYAEQVTSAAPRPDDTWRVCGQALTDAPGRGCTCSSGGPWPEQVRAALGRLAGAR